MSRTQNRPGLNATTRREMQLSDLTRRIARARETAEHGANERAIMIRRYGLAHPRSIAASQRLVGAQQAYRQLMGLHSRSESELHQMKAHDRVRIVNDPTASSHP